MTVDFGVGAGSKIENAVVAKLFPTWPYLLQGIC